MASPPGSGATRHATRQRVALLAFLAFCSGVGPAAAIETLDMLRAFQSGESTTDSTPGTFSTALCVANNSSDARDFLVVASFSQETTGSSTVAATADYRLAVTDGVTTTYSTTGQRFLDGGNDKGNGMLAWIFTNVSGTGTCDTTGTRFLLEHADDNAQRPVGTDRITLLAIPLDTSPNNVSLDWARVTQGDSTTFATTSTSFAPVDGMTTQVTIDNANAPRGAYVVATFSSEAATIAAIPAVGEWTLQGSADGITWVNIGSQIKRSMSRIDESGMIQLAAIVEGLDAGSYSFRLATLTQDANEPVVTKRAQLAAVSLVYAEQGGGYFPWFNDTYENGECDATSSNSPSSLDGVIAGSEADDATCDDQGTPDPLSDDFSLAASSDVFTTFLLNANALTSGGSGTGSFENEIWSGLPGAGTAVFGNDNNGESNEVERYFSGFGDRGSMGQVALWDRNDASNAAGNYNAYGGWSITGNAMETFEATIAGWVGASVDVLRDFGDAPSGYGDASHVIPASTGVYIGAVPPDDEAGSQSGANADGDDTNNVDDEEGVTLSAPAGGGNNIVASVAVTNTTGVAVTLCGWMDVDVNGAFDVGERQCSTAVSPGTNFAWIVGSAGTQTYYSRFRVCTVATECNVPTGSAADGEVEDYVITYNPTALTIGEVALGAELVDQLLSGLGGGAPALLELLAGFDAALAEALAGASGAEVEAALIDYLDPDGDGQVAILRWETLQERGTIGFYVERREGESGGWQRINRGMLPGLIDAPLGGEYWLADPDALPGETYQYRLIELEAWGTQRHYGPWRLGLE